MHAKEIKVDETAEAAWPEFQHQAQEWVGIAQDPISNMFVFVNWWSKQQGAIHSLLTPSIKVWIISLVYSQDCGSSPIIGDVSHDSSFA